LVSSTTGQREMCVKEIELCYEKYANSFGELSAEHLPLEFEQPKIEEL